MRIFDMFYQPWVRVFVDVRGAQYDIVKPKFADGRRLFRFAQHGLVLCVCIDRHSSVEVAALIVVVISVTSMSYMLK